MYYKVVRVNRYDKKLVSCVANAEWEVEYKVGERVQPNIAGSKLMVFDSYANAITFCGATDSDYKIYQCEADNPEVSLFVGFLSTYYKEFWDAYNKGKIDPCDCGESVAGTVFVDSVKLIKEAKHV